MNRVRPAMTIAVATLCFAPVLAQAPVANPTFDVVSIKRNSTPILPGTVVGVTSWRPDGGVAIRNVFLASMLAVAYPNTPIVGIPDWAKNERYDVTATSSLTRIATGDDRIAMMRAMLADRFKLGTHIEKRRQSVYDLVFARRDRRLGHGMMLSEVDCARIKAERHAASASAPRSVEPYTALPPCTWRILPTAVRDLRLAGSHLFEAEGTLDDLARFLRFSVDRVIVNKTGLTGVYRVTVNYDEPAWSPTDAPLLRMFTALPDQLGLKLESAQADVYTLVVDHLERATDN